MVNYDSRVDMARIITILNFKGGVGKTTCAIELATALARHHGRRTLLVDLDPQASATFYVMERRRGLVGAAPAAAA